MPTPTFPKYRKNALRPNPHTADPARGDLAFAQGTIMKGDFGDDGAAVRPALGLPPEGPVKPTGVSRGPCDPLPDDETAHGWR